ncbi:MAG TPA: amidohydrolase family protein [Thermoanaerobaculia bacterium]
MKAALLIAAVAFRGATLIDGTGGPIRRNALVLVSDGRIVSVGEATSEAIAALPKGATVIDVSGKWIIPGLIDAHVHAESDDDLKAMLRWGVTSVRLMAEDVAAAQKLAAESRTRADIPEVFPAAPIFTAKGGWWDQGEPADSHLNRFPATPQESREAVSKAKAMGSREIKLMLDDMAWCRSPRPALPRMAPDIAKALITEAVGQGLRAVVHAPNLGDAKEAISDGATALAHGVLEPIDANTVAIMKARPVFYIPTMDIFEFLADTRAFMEEVLSDPLAVRGLPRETVTRYRSAAYSQGYRERYPNFASVSKRLPALRENLRRLDEAGVPVALGTDMWAFPGLGVSIEMGCYIRSGISPLEAIRMATRNSARSLGIETDRGTLEPGKRADLLVLDADPLARVENVRAIHAVYKEGRAIERSGL